MKRKKQNIIFAPIRSEKLKEAISYGRELKIPFKITFNSSDGFLVSTNIKYTKRKKFTGF